MPITKAAVLAKERNRLLDTVTTYHYSDALLHELREASLLFIQQAIMEVDADAYLTRRVYTAITDALDKGTAGAADVNEFYPLPDDMLELRWIERADGSYHPKLWQCGAGEQEMARFSALFRGQHSADKTSYYSHPFVGGYESISIHGDRFRVLPAPASTAHQFGVWYVRQVQAPEGTSEHLDIPDIWEEALILDTCIRAFELDGDPRLQTFQQRLGMELAQAKDTQRRRRGTHITISGVGG